MVMRVRLTVDVHSLPFKVRLKVLTLHAELTAVTYLEPSEISPVDEAANGPLRDLERVSYFPKREKFQIHLLANYGHTCPALTNDTAAAK